MHPRATGGVLTEIVEPAAAAGGTDEPPAHAHQHRLPGRAGARAARRATSSCKALNEALGGGGWHEIDSEDGPVRLDLGQVVYVSAESDEPRVGFG